MSTTKARKDQFARYELCKYFLEMPTNFRKLFTAEKEVQELKRENDSLKKLSDRLNQEMSELKSEFAFHYDSFELRELHGE